MGNASQRWVEGLREVAATVADLVHPRFCAVCGAPHPSPGHHLCWDCQGNIEYHRVDVFCELCGRSFPGELPARFTCGTCKDRRPAFDAARSAAHFRGPVRDLVHAFKYNAAVWLRRDLVDLVEACVRQHFANETLDAVCPVPLHVRKLRERGYNQAALLGHELARRLRIPCFADALQRVRYTGTQTQLHADERHRNAAGAFLAKPLLVPWLEGRCVLVVDDVMTTGATVGDAARALKAAGVQRVLVATVARD